MSESIFIDSPEEYRVNWVDPLAHFYDEFLREPALRMQKPEKAVKIDARRYAVIYQQCRMDGWPKTPPEFYILYGIRVESE